MKKITFLMLFFSTFWGYSQIRNYTFTQTFGTYSEIATQTGSTTLGDTNSDAQFFVDPSVPLGGSKVEGVGFPIGFNFTFNGKVYDKFAVSNEGWICLGISNLTPSVSMNISKYVPLSDVSTIMSTDLSARIAALVYDLKAQSQASLSFQTIGTSPNRVLVVQWKNYRKTTNGDGDSFDFQIRLNETTNVVQIVYGDFVSNATPGVTVQVGMRAEPAAVASNFVGRTSSTDWSSSIAGAVATDRMPVSNMISPAKGLTFAWAPSTCGGAKDFTVTSITTSAATLNWGSYIPAPDGYEYVYSTSSALPTGSGTTTTATTASLSGLDASTVYNVFMRTRCSSQSTPWLLAGTFKTKCLDVSSVFEDFDSYTASVSPQIVPNCWDKIITVTGTGAGVVTIASNGGSNRLKMYGNGSTTAGDVAYAILPAVSNLHANTHRLKFKAYSTETLRTIDVGYFLDSNDPNSFQSGMVINLPSADATSALEFIYTPGVVPSGIKNLVFRNLGSATTGTNSFIDNVVWEPIPACSDVKTVAANAFTDTSANITWAKASAESNWQYVYALTAVSDPYILTAVDVSGDPQATISGLASSTTYKVWVRSKCDDGTLGAWVGPVLFTTTCAPVTEMVQTFDSVAAGTALPSCWLRVGTTGNLSISTLTSLPSPSSPNSMKLTGASVSALTIVALPALSNTADGTHQLRLKVSASVIGASLDIGWLSDVTDTGSFHFLQNVAPTTANSYSEYIYTFGADPGSPYLAFRNSGTPKAGDIYIDDVIWEAITSCQSLSAISADLVESTTADLSWTVNGSENKWQYALAPVTESNPYAVTATDFVSPTEYGTSVTAKINGLNPATAYKVWLRSKCSDTSFGSWNGPILITTSCAPIGNYSQNFDSSADFPACWSKVGSTGSAAVSTDSGTTVPSYPFVLNIAASSAASPAVVAMPAVNNATAGTHQLTFKYRASSPNATLEAGYLKNLADPSSFVPLNVPLTCTTSYQTAAVVFAADEVGSEVLAFRNNGSASANIFIDNVAWQPLGYVAPPVNDEALGAVSLTVGQNFGSNSVIGNNVGATASVQESPGCGGYNGMDVWYSAIVPASGNVTFEINSIAGGITNSAAAVYSGSLSSLVLVNCNDSGSTAGDDHPKISLTGRAIGEKLYLRVWKNGGVASGSFLVSAYDETSTAVLGSVAFDDVSFSFYPNPVKDILNLSFSQKISDVTVFNMLGQQMIFKSVNASQSGVDMSCLSNGTYLVKVTAGNQMKTIRIIKE